MVNRKDINDIIKIFLPVSSNIIGAPRRTATVKEYAEIKPACCKLHHIPLPILHKEPVQPPAFFKTSIVTWEGETFVANLKNARVWGCNGAVIAAHDYFIAEVSREFNKGLNIEHSVFYNIKQLKATKLLGVTAVIGTAGSGIYYHWMIDILPRLALIKSIKQFKNIDYFVTGFIELPFQTETLAKLEIPKEKIIPSNSNQNFHVNAEVLLAPSFAGELDQPNELQVSFLRSLYEDSMSKRKPFRLLYISRKKTKRRAIINENKLMEILTSFGFEIVYCEELQVNEQVLLFSEASIIISSHGSALTNIVFCEPTTIVIDIFNPSHVNACFWFISQINKLEYHYLLGEAKPIDDNPKNDQTIVELGDLNRLLEKIGLNV